MTGSISITISRQLTKAGLLRFDAPDGEVRVRNKEICSALDVSDRSAQDLRRLGLKHECGHVLPRRCSEPPSVLTAELELALVSNPVTGLPGVESFTHHQSPGLLEAKPLLILNRAHRRHALEVKVQSRGAHPYMLGERFDTQRVSEMILEPPNCASDPLGHCTGRGDLA